MSSIASSFIDFPSHPSHFEQYPGRDRQASTKFFYDNEGVLASRIVYVEDKLERLVATKG